MPMLFDYMTLKLLMWAMVGLLLIFFALTDGFDLGIGCLLPFVSKTDDERRVVINTIGPIWEGQQVWFIAAGTLLFAAWPLAYATSFSAFYLVLLLLLWTLFLRPVAFDYRSKMSGRRWRSAWDWTLFVASLVPAIVFGAAFGNLLLGVSFHFDTMLHSFYTGNIFQLLHPFAVLCGLVSVCMLVMHGSHYLMMRVHDPIYSRARVLGNAAALLYVFLFLLGGYFIAYHLDGYRIVQLSGSAQDVLTPLNKTVQKEVGLWLLNYQLYPWTKILPVLGVVMALASVFFSRIRFAKSAFVASSMTVIATIATASFAMFPFIFPSKTQPSHSLTIWDAAAGQMSLNMIAFFNIVLLPIIMIYVVWVYRKLWGKVTVSDIHHDDKTLY